MPDRSPNNHPSHRGRCRRSDAVRPPDWCRLRKAFGVSCSCPRLPGGPDEPGPGRKGSAMAKNIYVGNLVWEANMDDLFALFQEHGEVAQALVIMDRETGRSRGFGFVVMNNDAEAQKAIDAL